MKTILNIFTNGHIGTWNSVEFSAYLAKRLNARIRLIGVIEPDDIHHPVEDMFSRAITLFRESEVEFDLELENGYVENIVKARKELLTSDSDGDEEKNIVVIGPFGRSPLKKLLVGISFRNLMGMIAKPIFYIQESKIPVTKILVCVGGLGISVISEDIVLTMSQPGETELTLLTVVPPVDFDYPEARMIRENWARLPETDTIVGKTLKHGLQAAEKAGISAKCKVRHGNIMEEIKSEIASGEYDLIVMGSTYSSTSLRQMYSPNFTADIAESFSVSILTIRKIIAG